MVILCGPGKMLLRRLIHLQKKAQTPKSAFSPDPFQAQHATFRIEENKTERKTTQIVRNIGNTPLSWLIKRKGKDGKSFISASHLEAGEKLSQDFEYAGALPKTTGFYDGVPISGKSKRSWQASSPSERQMAAKKRVNAALDYVGPGLSDILVRVCCFHEGLEQAERELAWPSRSGKLVLRMGLERLANHYNLKKYQ